MKTPPEITEAEIRAAMDFKHVLALTEAARLRSRRITRRVVTSVLVAALVATAWITYEAYHPSEVIPVSQAPQLPLTTPADTTAAIDTTAQSAPRPAAKTKQAVVPAPGEKKQDKPAVHVDSVKSVFIPAEPAAGYPALYNYFAKELRYPASAIRDSVRGVVSVSFVINTDGKPEQVTTDHALGDSFNQEAIRLIEQMPAWKPAQLDGSPVKSKVSVPISFSVKTLRQR